MLEGYTPRDVHHEAPSIAEVTEQRIARDAAMAAETKAHREGRDELRKQSPDWPLRRASHPLEQR
jgi:hypothetical protein